MLDVINMGNGCYMELNTYNVVILPMEETKQKVEKLTLEDKEKLNTFISNLEPRDGEPKHSNLWSQTKDYTGKYLPTFNGEDVTNIVEMYERGNVHTLFQ